MRVCHNRARGCSHQDIDEKCSKHETYFCPQTTKCVVCDSAVTQVSMFAHYDSACKKVFRADSTWRALRTLGKNILVPGAAGTAMCFYWMTDIMFHLDVHIPVSSERLREFRCVVRVTQPATGLVRTYTPDTLYDTVEDWIITVKKEEFPKWGSVLDVIVDITKITAAMRVCHNRARGCSHQDIDEKCSKHQTYFCPQTTKCVVCDSAVTQVSMFAHYDSACKKVFRADSTWRALRTLGKNILVPGAAGTAMCFYWMTDTMFHLDVHIPVSSERLREFRCVVRVTQPATGLVRTYTPDTLYDTVEDWIITVKKEEFPKWGSVLDVIVDITKITAAMRVCHNRARGCSHQDIDEKCSKHQTYFCPQTTKCVVCDSAVTQVSMFAHYDSACKKVFRADSTWRALRTLGKNILVPGAAGTAMCFYWMTDTMFHLDVHIPVSSERLREFRCVVRVIQPATGLVRTYTPDTLYDTVEDWIITVKKEEFPKWGSVLDVIVDITKVQH